MVYREGVLGGEQSMGEFPCGSCFLLHILGLINTKDNNYTVNITLFSEKQWQK
jgi:hypothetical protein